MEDRPVLPWGDCKIAFDVQDDDALWAAQESGELQLPPGWALIETDCAGARIVAIFRISGVPTTADGELVAAEIARIDAQAVPD